MSQENVAIVQRLVDAFNRDDVATVVAAFDERCAVEEPPQMPDSPPTGYRGHDGIREWMGNLRGVAGTSFELRSFTSSDDVLLCELASRGRGRGSELPIEWTTFALVDIRGARIARIRVFLSRQEALEALELSD